MSKWKNLGVLAIAVVFALVASGLAAAHHSLSGIYDTGANVSFEGVIREFRFVNPHPYLTVEIRVNNRIEAWKMEMDNLGELSAIGMTAATFKNGDPVTVSGYPGRHGAKALYLRKLDRPRDGFWYTQDDSTPEMGYARRN
jgi:hypothetical protein